MTKITTDFTGTEDAATRLSRIIAITDGYYGAGAAAAAGNLGGCFALLNPLMASPVGNGEAFGSWGGKLNTLNDYRPSNLAPAVFGAGDKGIILDPSATGSLFQDTAGASPVTAAGQSVGRILDLSGLGFHASQATASKLPTYQVDGSGLPYLSMDGVDDLLSTAAVEWGSEAVTVVAAIRRQSASGARQLASFGSAGTDAGSWALMARGGTGDPVAYGARRRWSSPTYDFYSPNAYPATETAVISMVQKRTGEAVSIRRNGVLDVDSSTFNRVGKPNDLSAFPWYLTNIGATKDSGVAPDGSTTATLLVPNATSGLHRVLQVLNSGAGVSAKLTVYLKNAGQRYAYVNAEAFMGAAITVDLTNGAYVSSGDGPFSVTDVGGGWFKVTAQGVVLNAPVQIHIQANTSLVATDHSFVGDGVSGFYAWGVGLTETAFPVGNFGTWPLNIGSVGSDLSSPYRLYGLLAINKALPLDKLTIVQEWAARKIGVTI